ncbi:MAG: lipid-A-disaccharide synthase [Planctomycetes bacterium]|nr:lipid-A-disaccharide synthase [Planctomycetota bacterium]
MRIFFSVGEPSGDLHGANLIRDLHVHNPDLECVGYGGPRMAAAGCHIHEDLTKYALMGVVSVLSKIVRFWSLVRRAECFFRLRKVDAVVLIDYPGFNWWVARRAKRHNIPVFYYGTPQMWAWAPWRVKKTRRLVDHVLCKLPFEERWFQERGCAATFVGHPYFDELERRQLDAKFVEQHTDNYRPLVTILPGSRTQEAISNLPWLLNAAEKVSRNVANVRFAIASFNDEQAAIARQEVKKRGLQMDVIVGRTHELIHLAKCCLACSGSVSLELLYHVKPSVIQYRINRLNWLVQALVLNVKYITLVNLFWTNDIHSRSFRVFDPDAEGAERVPFPEYLTSRDKSDRIALHVIRWLTDNVAYQERVEQLRDLKLQYCHSGASEIAARYILNKLGSTATEGVPANSAAA